MSCLHLYVIWPAYDRQVCVDCGALLGRARFGGVEADHGPSPVPAPGAGLRSAGAEAQASQAPTAAAPAGLTQWYSMDDVAALLATSRKAVERKLARAVPKDERRYRRDRGRRRHLYLTAAQVAVIQAEMYRPWGGWKRPSSPHPSS